MNPYNSTVEHRELDGPKYSATGGQTPVPELAEQHAYFSAGPNHYDTEYTTSTRTQEITP